MESNLGNLSLKELKQLQKEVAKAISTFEDRQKSEARARLETTARELGYSLADFVGTPTKGSRAAAAPKYRNPTQPELTWSGRGRKPLWFVDAISRGKKPSDLAL